MFPRAFANKPVSIPPASLPLKAKVILEETDDTIDQTAEKVGFDSYNGFSTAFKKIITWHQRNIETDYPASYIASWKAHSILFHNIFILFRNRI